MGRKQWDWRKGSWDPRNRVSSWTQFLWCAGDDQPSTVVEPRPRATGLTFDEIIADHLEYLHHEAFYVVLSTFEVTAYRTLWFDLQYDLETVGQVRDFLVVQQERLR